jgi:hypothetical protein
MTKRLGIVFVSFVIWLWITIGLGKLLAGSETSLSDAASHGVGWSWFLAGAFILAVCLWQGWTDVALNRGAAVVHGSLE